MSARGAAKRRELMKRRENLDLLIADLIKQVKALTPVLSQSGSPYATARLARVRQMLDRVDAKMLASDDPDEIETLSRASKALDSQEAALSGRPSPGTLKPNTKAAPAGPPPIVEPETD